MPIMTTRYVNWRKIVKKALQFVHNDNKHHIYQKLSMLVLQDYLDMETGHLEVGDKL